MPRRSNKAVKKDKPSKSAAEEVREAKHVAHAKRAAQPSGRSETPTHAKDTAKEEAPTGQYHSDNLTLNMPWESQHPEEERSEETSETWRYDMMKASPLLELSKNHFQEQMRGWAEFQREMMRMLFSTFLLPYSYLADAAEEVGDKTREQSPKHVPSAKEEKHKTDVHPL